MCVRRRKEGEYIRTRSTISILSILRFRTLIKRLEFFSERKFHLCGDATLLLFRGGTTDFSLPRRGSRRELRGLLFIRTYVRDRANVSPLISAIFSRPMWPIADDRDESWDFPRKRKKEKKKNVRRFRGSFEEERDDASRKAIRGTKREERETIEGGKSTRQDRMSMETRLIMIYGEEICSHRWTRRCPAIRKISRGENLNVTRDRTEILRNSPFLYFWSYSSQNLNYHEDRQPHLSSPSNWSRQRAIKLSKFIENAR